MALQKLCLVGILPCVLAAQSTLTLSTSGNPSALGQALTLTATLSPAANSGRVTFYDGVAILGAKPLAAGTASLPALLPAGIHKLFAEYRDDANSLVRTSNFVSQTVRASGGGAFVPVDSFLDFSIAATADFNLDGKPDLAYSKFSPAIRVALGKGDGTFQLVPDTASGPNTTALAVGDFNGDGIPDIAAGRYSSTPGSGPLPIPIIVPQVDILLGNGDGSFRPPLTYPGTGPLIAALAVGDFNGDGKADLVVAYTNRTLKILTGNGDGTFASPLPYADLGVPLLAADLNGDRNPDLALGNLATFDFTSRQFNTPAAPAVLPGKGDGTALPAIPFTPGSDFSTVFHLVAGDFNGDGKTDLAVGGDASNATVTTWILLGNGDGTFQRGASYATGSAIVAGDFNGDGVTDLVITDFNDNMTGILNGRGDGTFVAGLAISAGIPLLVADFNADGRSDLLTANPNSTNSTVVVLLGADHAAFTLSATGGTPQTSRVLNSFVVPLEVTLLNGGAPVAGATVNFTSPTGNLPNPTQQPTEPGAYLLSSTALTNAAGKASVGAIANSVTGSYQVTASYLGATTTFALTNIDFAALTVTSGTPQTATVLTPFPAPLAATVTDASGHPVGGVTVRFTAPTTGASAVLSSAFAVTDQSGIARVTATASSTVGSFEVTADTGGFFVRFALTNVAGSTGSVTATGGTPQATAAGTAFPLPLQVTVKDSSGNPIVGTTVTFAQPGAGPSAAAAVLSSPTAVTNASGVASVTATANGVAGSYPVTASVGSLSTSFSLTNLLAVTVNLTVSPNPSTLGAPVVLSAGITPADVPGRIVFFDGVTILGTKTVSGGAASISTILLPAGVRKLRAFFKGPANYAATNSNVVTQQVNANASGAFTLQSALSVAPAAPRAVAAGDFNGDGKLDLVATGASGGNLVMVALGRGDGTFQPPVSYPVTGGPVYVAVGDLDNDGIQDLAVSGTTQLNILLGNGNGTFRQGATYPVPGFPNGFPVSIADFNGDGIPDLLRDAAWIGKGDGTFQSQDVVADPSNLQSSGVGDWNEDGKADLLLVRLQCTTFTTPMGSTQIICTVQGNVSLGNGDGTFRPSTAAFSTSSPFSPPSLLVARADVNHDGHDDFVYSDGGNLYWVAGIGNGTFTQKSTINIPTGARISALAGGDFDGDGLADVAAIMVNNGISALTLLLGNGDTTFRLGVSVAVPASGDAPVVGDLNGDGRTDFIVTNAAGQSLTIIPGAAPGTGAQLTATSGANQTANTGSAFALPLTVTLRNGGSPVSGVTVTFVAPATAFSASAVLVGSTAVTDAAGVASIVAIANQYTGSYTVTATAQGLLATFALSNSGTQLTGTSASGPQATRPGTAFALPLRVTVTGVGPVGRGVVVRFSAPASGASAVLSSPTAVTDDSGVATITAVAKSVVGNYIVTAIVGTGEGNLTARFLMVNSSDGTLTNLATGKAVSQSSTYPGYSSAAAASAVDGNTDGNFFHNSVTATNSQDKPWWQVDLGASATIDAVGVWNRTDCCADRLYGFWLFISDTPFNDSDTPEILQSRAGTFVFNAGTFPNPYIAVAAGGAQGRYIRVQLQAYNGILSLAEVQVVGRFAIAPSANLSQGKPARQSSTYPGIATAGASSAVDGNPDGAFYNGSVTATDLENSPWWQVDLGGAATVDSLVVWNRTDCCGSRLGDYWVFVSNTPFNDSDTVAALQNRAATFASHQMTAPGPSTAIPAGAPGRYVRVQLATPGYLSLAEVQVFGTGAPAVTNLAQGRPATQSSTFPGYTTDGPGAAVDGNTDGAFFNGSVTATNADPNAWWQVDLGSSAAVGSVVVWNRTDCCASRLNDYWVFVSDTPFNATDTPATLQNRAGTFASHQTTPPASSTSIPVGAPGRYVRVQLSGTNNLSLAEVQVFGQ